VQKKYGVPHIETGVIFRQNISKKLHWERRQKHLSIAANLYLMILRFPMILDRLKGDDCKKGWLLDGFPVTWLRPKPLDSTGKRKNQTGLRH